MFSPKVLSPVPDPAFVRELRKIDPDLRVVWGYERYLKSAWTIERRMPPERYFACYASILESGEPRFIQQPIYDTNRPIYGYVADRETGLLNLHQMGYEIVGYRTFDLAPEYEWVQFVQEKDGSFRPLDQRTLTELKRAYAWDRNQPLSRIKFEQEQEQAAKEKALAQKRMDIAMEALPEAFRAVGKTLFGGQPTQVMEGTQISPNN
jgi:hypothetical protein